MSIIEKYKKIPIAARASAWFVICSILQKGVAFLTTPIFTRLMSVEQYGQVTIYNSWVEVFMIFATLDIFYGVYNNALTKYPDDRERVTSSMLGLCTSLTIGLFVVYLALHSLINKLTGMTTSMTLFLFVELLFVPAFYFWSTKERYEYKYRKLIVITILMTILAPTIGIPAVKLFAEKGYAKIITAVLSQVVFAIGLYISVFKKGKVFFDQQYWKYALAFNLPLIPHYLSSTILNQCDRIMIDRMCGTDKAGIYGLAFTVGAMVIIFNQAIMNTLTPYTYQSLKKEDYSGLRKTVNYLVIFIAIVSLSILMIAPEIMTVLGDERYSEGIWIIAPIAASMFFRFLYGLYANIEFYYEENYLIMIASVIGAIANIITNYVFIREYGFLAAGYTTLGCFALYALAHCYFSCKVLRKHVSLKTIYDNRLIMIVSIAVIILSVLMMLLYPYRIVRLGLIAAIAVGILMARNRIIGIIKRMKEE